MGNSAEISLSPTLPTADDKVFLRIESPRLSESRHFCGARWLRIVWLLKLTGRYVTDGLQQLSVIKPVDPFEGGKFYVLDMTPRPLPSNHLGIKQSDDRFGQGAVVRGTDTGHPDPGSWIDIAP